MDQKENSKSNLPVPRIWCIYPRSGILFLLNRNLVEQWWTNQPKHKENVKSIQF